MSNGTVIGEVSWERMIHAVEKVKSRLQRAARTRADAHIPGTVVGGNVVAASVSRADEAAVRNTRGVDILLRREDPPRAIVAMETAGFLSRHAASIDMHLDGRGVSARDAVHIVFANEKERREYFCTTGDVDDCDKTGEFRWLSLEALVCMKLTSYRDKDRTHLRDFIEIGLLDQTWPSRFSEPLDQRLQDLLDNPAG